MGLEESHLCLVIYDVFSGQQIPMVRDVLSKSNVNVPANCIDKLQTLDISVSKPFKEETNSEEVQKRLTSGTAVLDVKIDMHTSVLKPKSANWLIAALN